MFCFEGVGVDQGGLVTEVLGAQFVAFEKVLFRLGFENVWVLWLDAVPELWFAEMKVINRL